MKVCCPKNVNGLPVLTGCPGDDEYFMVSNAIGGWGNGKYGLRSWAQLKACVCLAIQGEGIFTVNGTQMTNGLPMPDTAPGNIYLNEAYAGMELVIYYNGVNRFLLPTEYMIVEEGGFQVLLADVFTDEDNFVVFPNNTCEIS